MYRNLWKVQFIYVVSFGYLDSYFKSFLVLALTCTLDLKVDKISYNYWALPSQAIEKNSIANSFQHETRIAILF